jgi:O-antigen/teichoic acid export membrane protein
MGRAFFSNAALIVCSGFSCFCGVIFIFSPEILLFFSPNALFQPLVTGLLELAALFIALTAPLNIGGLKQGKTHWLIISVAIAAVFQIGLAILLVPYFGLLGAAVATMLSSLASLIFQNFISQRIHAVPFNYVFLVLVVVSWALFCWLIYNMSFSIWLRMVVTIFMVILQMLLVRRSDAWKMVAKSTSGHI